MAMNMEIIEEGKVQGGFLEGNHFISGRLHGSESYGLGRTRQEAMKDFLEGKNFHQHLE